MGVNDCRRPYRASLAQSPQGSDERNSCLGRATNTAENETHFKRTPPGEATIDLGTWDGRTRSKSTQIGRVLRKEWNPVSGRGQRRNAVILAANKVYDHMQPLHVVTDRNGLEIRHGPRQRTSRNMRKVLDDLKSACNLHSTRAEAQGVMERDI